MIIYVNVSEAVFTSPQSRTGGQAQYSKKSVTFRFHYQRTDGWTDAQHKHGKV